MDVAMSNLESRNDEPHSLAGECQFEGSTDAVRYQHEMGSKFGIEITPLINLCARHDKTVAGGYRVDRHQHDAAVIAVRDVSGKFAIDNAGEDTGHGLKLASTGSSFGTMHSCAL